MIFYFSATGNTKHVADEIRLSGEALVTMDTMLEQGRLSFEISDGRIGILSPTYDWGLPSVVYEFLEKASFSFRVRPYIFYVGTYGTTSGTSSSFVSSLLKKKNLKLDASFDIRMPDTWTVLFDLSDPSKVNRRIEDAETQIEELKMQLEKQIKGKHLSLTFPLFVGKLGKKIYDGKTRKTSNLSVSDRCIGCGLCARKCPVKAIEMKDCKPVWVKESCAMCLGCLHRCPRYAIYYGNGKATNKHGQYTYLGFCNKRIKGKE